MTSVRIYAATSLDGFAADGEGSIEWLERFEPHNYGYESFLAGIGCIILGRRTYELVRAIGEWPYRGKRVMVLASEPLWNLPDGTTYVGTGLEAAVQAARAMTPQDIWIAGGAITMQTALDAGLVDILEIFIVPVMLGTGIPLVNPLESHQKLAFDGSEAFDDGVVKLRYRPLGWTVSPTGRRTMTFSG